MTLDTFPTIAECSLRCLRINMLSSMTIRSHTSAVQRNYPGILCVCVYIYIHFKDTRTPHSKPRPVLIEVSLIATHFSSATFEGLNILFQCGKKGTKISHYRFCKGHSSAWSWGLFLITGYTSYRQGLY